MINFFRKPAVKCATIIGASLVGLEYSLRQEEKEWQAKGYETERVTRYNPGMIGSGGPKIVARKKDINNTPVNGPK